MRLLASNGVYKKRVNFIYLAVNLNLGGESFE